MGFFYKDKSVLKILKNIDYVITLDTNNYCTQVTKLDVTMIILIGDTNHGLGQQIFKTLLLCQHQTLIY